MFTIKSEQEIELMRGPAGLLERVHEELGKELKPGMSQMKWTGSASS